MIFSIVAYIVGLTFIGQAHGQESEKLDLFNSVISCEDSIDKHLEGREIYSGSSCESYAYRLRRVWRPYGDFGRYDREHGYNSPENFPADRLQQRLVLCLKTDRAMAEIFDAMDASRCNPYATNYYGYTDHARVPRQTSNDRVGAYGHGTFTHAGDTSFGSDGTVYHRSGNVTTGSDGTVYVHSGQVTHGSDGTTYVTSGNITHGSDGSTCIRSGDITHCH